MPIRNVPLPDAVSAKLPSGRDALLAHRVKVDSDRWRRELSLRHLPAPTGLLGGYGMVQISRKDLFKMADMEPTPDRALQLLFASLAWGLGTKGSYIKARLDGVAKGRNGAADLLVNAWEHVRQGFDARSCYEDLITQRGAGRILGNGPAFASKFLYFAQDRHATPRCLILDRVVAGQLRKLGVWPTAQSGGWPPSTYAKYCELTSRWASEATTRAHHQVEADEVEYALFNLAAS